MKMLYQINLTNKELDIIVSSLKSSDVDNGVVEMLTNYIASEMKVQEQYRIECDKKHDENRKFFDNLRSENSTIEKEDNVDKMAKKASNLHRR